MRSNIVVKVLMLLIFFIFNQGGTYVHSQITLTSPNITPSYAVTDILLGAGVTATNIKFNGSPFIANNQQASVREFTNSSTLFPLSNGVMMQTLNAPGITDPDLSAITANTVSNGVVLEFDFVPDGDSLSFSYIFTSAEYTTFTCNVYNDVFGFFISGPGINGPYSNNSENIAIIPGSANIPVGINTVNAGTHPDGSGNCASADPNWQANSVFFTTDYNGVYNNSQNLNASPKFNGSTVELTANASVICGETYHIKLAISNVGDNSYDSGVFLKAGSFASTPAIELNASNITSSFSDSVIVKGCHEGNFCFERPVAQTDETAVIHYIVSGTADLGVDYNFSNLPNTGDSIVLLPGESSTCLNVVPVDNGMDDGIKNVILTTFTVNACGDTTFNVGELWIADRPADLITDAGPDTLICGGGGTGILNGTGTTSFNEVNWTYEGPGTINFTPNAQDLNAEFTLSAPGEYLLFLTEVNDSCDLEKVDTMIVVYEEFTFITSNDTTICENGTATLLANSIGGNSFVYNWGHTANLGSTQSVSPTDPTDYTVYAESDLGCITPTESIHVDILPPLDLSSTASQVICPGESINITATATGGNGGPYTYEWKDPAGTVVGTANVLNVSPSESIVYTVTTNDGCESTPKVSTSEIIVAELPNIEFSVVDGEVCTPARFELFDQTDPNSVQDTYWNISDGQTFMQNDGVEVLIKEAGSYDVQMVVVTPDGCVDSLTVNGMLTVYPKPNADFTYFPKPATILNTEVHFQNYSEGAEDFQWYFEEGTPAFSSLKDPKTKYQEGVVGTYDVDLIVISMYDCRDTVSKIVAVVPEVLIFAPNSFTPDGDEHNPTWKPVVEGIDKMNVTVEVFNRWGEKVWESHNLDVGWDGTYGVGGGLVKVGAYVWKIRATNLINDDKYVWDGVVNVIY